MADRYYVVLTDSDPDYNPDEPRYIMEGFVDPDDLAIAYPGDNYHITTSKPDGAVFYKRLSRAEKLKIFFETTVLDQKNNAPTALQIAVMTAQPTIDALVKAELYTAAKAMVDGLDVGESQDFASLKDAAKAVIDGDV